MLLLSLLAVALTLSLTQASGARAATVSASSPSVTQPPDPMMVRASLAAIAARSAHAQPAAPRTYTVHSGNTLSQIAQRFYGRTTVWPCVYDANRAKVHNPNDIYVGQHLLVPVHLKLTGCHAPPVISVVTTAAYTDGDGDHDGDRSDGTPAYTTTASTGGNYGNVSPSGYSGFQACVIARESSGNSQVMNSSGHYGLYQFSASTWAAAGGNPALFGHASVSYQNQVFAWAYAKFGTSPWAPYDGC